MYVLLMVEEGVPSIVTHVRTKEQAWDMWQRYTGQRNTMTEGMAIGSAAEHIIVDLDCFWTNDRESFLLTQYSF